MFVKSIFANAKRCRHERIYDSVLIFQQNFSTLLVILLYIPHTWSLFLELGLMGMSSTLFRLLKEVLVILQKRIREQLHKQSIICL